MSRPIILNADSVRDEIDEAPEVHNLLPAQVTRINEFSDEEINTAILEEVDDDFWTAYDDVRSRAISRLAGNPLILVVHVEGDNYEKAVDEANANGGSVDAVIQYLSAWDYGDETDSDSGDYYDLTELASLQKLPHQLHDGHAGGDHYWLLLDHGLRFYSLYRRPVI